MMVLFALAFAQAGTDFRTVAEQARGVVVIEVDLEGGRAEGSGFAVGDGTTVVTAHHVVAGARSIRLRVDGATAVSATEVLALDPDHDLALLKVSQPLPVLSVSPDAPPVAGSAILAVGNPRGLGLSFTDGIISRIHDDIGGVRIVQHSAPISPGNSGGPLLDTDGRVIGVNSFALASDFGQNVNFAVAAEHVRALLADPESYRPRPPHVLVAPRPEPSRGVTASRRWKPPEDQPRCASPEEPAWPFATEVPLHELPAVRQDALGVCRAGQQIAYARYGGVDARDERLAAILAELEVETVDAGDPCRRAGSIGGVELWTTRNRDVLHVWLRSTDEPGEHLCDLAARIRDGAKH